jgi:hypothetical protein
MNFSSQQTLFSSAILASKPQDSEQIYTVPGTYSWIAPPKVRRISVVVVGGGGSPIVQSGSIVGGGGGGLSWRNNIEVVPGQSYTVIVGSGGKSTGTSTLPISGENGSNSSFISNNIITEAYGGLLSGIGGTFFGSGGGNGGSGFSGGGGAGGYSGNGGTGGSIQQNGSEGIGGAGGGGGGSWAGIYLEQNSQPGAASAGGGAGLFGQTDNGFGGLAATGPTSLESATPGGGGSGGTNGETNGGLYGGGGRAGFIRSGSPTIYISGGSGSDGAVRIIWPGNTRAFPAINTVNT